MVKGNLMVDAIVGLMVIACIVIMVSMCMQSVVKVKTRSLDLWQVEENVCEIWCDSFWFYDD